MPSSLVADAAALVDNFSAGREQLRVFAEAHPVEAIYSELSSPESSIDAAAVAVVARALAKVFADPELAAAWLPETRPFAVAALRSSEAPEQLRALAAEALGRCVAAGVGRGGGDGPSSDDTAAALVEALADASAAVGAAAERGGRLAAATEVGATSLLSAGLVSKMSLGEEQQGAAASAAVARARALSVAAAALAAGAGPAAALRDAGAFSAVSEQLRLQKASRDPLSAASALATISDAVESVLLEGEKGVRSGSSARAAAIGAMLAAEVGRPLARLLAASAAGTSPKIAFAVRMQAMQTAAKLVAAAVSGGGGGNGGGGDGSGAAEGGQGNGGGGGDNDSTDAAAVAAAPAASPSSSSPIPSPASPVGGLAAALLASIERSLDEEAAVGRDGEIAEDDDEEGTDVSSEEEASLLALAELASTAGGASLAAAASPDALRDAARIALGGRGGPACRLAALHALATVAGVERMRRGKARGRGAEEAEEPEATGVLLPGAGESVLAAALMSGASTRAVGNGSANGGDHAASTPAGALLSLVSRQPLPDEKVAALRLALALCARPWGAAEVAMHSGLLARLVDVGADAAGAAAEWRHAVCVALAETAAGALAEGARSTLGPTQMSALEAARSAVEAAVRSGPHGIGGPAPRFVATRAAN